MQQTSSQAYLIIRLGSRWTDVLRLQPDQMVTVGRASDNNVVVRDERVSRHHSQISPTSGGWIVRDLGSRNGTQVDGVTIAEPHALLDGQTIQVGGCCMTFSHSLTSGFAASRRRPDQPQESQSAHQTQEMGTVPTIVNRRSNSRWSDSREQHANDVSANRGRLAPVGNTGSDPVSRKWNFFYRLVFDLVGCDSQEQAAQLALERLLEQLEIASGGVVTIEPGPRQPAEAVDTMTMDAAAELPSMAVLAARQPTGGSYRRVSDFLVSTVVHDRQAVLARNVQDDSNLSLARESARREIVSIICAPLRIREQDGEQVIGILHVYSSGDERMLNEEDLDLCVGVADNLAIALSRQQAAQHLNQSLATSRRAIDLLQEQLQLSQELIGESRGLTSVKSQIRRAAPTAATVLIRGESGVGKELVARAIHAGSQRAQGPLVCLNCAALAPTLLESELFGHEKGAFTGATDRKIGKFEAAHEGTLLLDEIGEMPLELQAKFLRVLEGQPFERLGGNRPIVTDVRVLAATNRDLEEAVSAKQFRSDLYYRLRVIEISVPPLRERLDDVPHLVEFFMNQLRAHAGRRLTGIEPTALEVLCTHHWPGNVRELRNVIERAIVLGNHSTIRVEDLQLSTLGLPDGASPTPTGFQPISLAQLERVHILATLEHAGGNKTKASQLLGIERSTLDRKLKRYEADS